MDGLEGAAAPRLMHPAPVTLRPMTPREYGAWLPKSIASYARDIAVARGLEPGAALRQSKQAFDELLTAGLNTRRHWLLRIERGGAPVGVVWLAATSAGPDRCWIFDVLVDPAHRSTGIGSAALAAAENLAREAGFNAIELNVFDHNPRARSLYERLGYRVVKEKTGSAEMSKSGLSHSSWNFE
jgi:ribosomal protein S18 acetylase RimI-like enzyme